MRCKFTVDLIDDYRIISRGEFEINRLHQIQFAVTEGDCLNQNDTG